MLVDEQIEPEVSVIIPCYNSRKTILRAIKSVMAQHCKTEIILIDDCSSDNTAEIVQEHYGDDVRLFRLGLNVGAGAARNIGIDHARGRFIAFLDADDYWLEQTLGEKLSLIKATGASLCYSAYMVCEGNEQQRMIVPPRNVSFILEYCCNWFGTSTVLYDTRKVGKVFMPEMRLRQDWATWVRVLRKNPNAVRFDKCSMVYQIGKGSLSQNKLKMVKAHYSMFRKELGHSLVVSGLLLAINLLLVIVFKFFRTKSLTSQYDIK
jgi:teichuronic acid biosynthesis glycosyltransferase TuaG